MNTLDDLIEYVKNLPHDEKVIVGRTCLSHIENAMIAADIDEETRLAFVLAVIGVAVSSDRTTSFEEYALFCSIFGEIIKYETFYDLTNGGSTKEVIAKIDGIVDRLPAEIKRDCCTLALLFMTADGVVTGREREVFEQLLA